MILSPSATRDGLNLRNSALLLLLIAFAARWLQLGNPLVHVDEQFYLLVGGRMWQGAIPYVDIWDRKPIGLFLLFALFRALGGDEVWAYQVTAIGCIWLTAVLLFCMARRVAPRGGALAAGTLYILWFNLAGGEGGQSPVYYNLPVAAAMALILRSHDRARSGHNDYLLPGIIAMLLFGIAMQIKYSAVFEGIFAGIALLYLSWRNGATGKQLLGNAALWAICALIPTMAAAGFYWHGGHWREWWFANFESILLRRPQAPDILPGRVWKMAKLLAPFFLCLVLRVRLGCQPKETEGRFALNFMDVWAASALFGVVIFGTWFDHYALPLFAPFAIIIAPCWRHSIGHLFLCMMMIIAFVVGQYTILRHQSARGGAKELTEAINALEGMRNCPFVYSGFIALYEAPNACLPSTRPFPSHLQSDNEKGATGVDQVAEVQRILSHHPDRIMTQEPALKDENPLTRKLVYRELARHYRPIYRYHARTADYIVFGRVGSLPFAAPAERP